MITREDLFILVDTGWHPALLLRTAVQYIILISTEKSLSTSVDRNCSVDAIPSSVSKQVRSSQPPHFVCLHPVRFPGPYFVPI